MQRGPDLTLALESRGAPRQRLPFTDARRLTVGRSSSCDVVLLGDDRVSRQHLLLVALDRAWHVTQVGRHASTLVRASTRFALRRSGDDGPGRHYALRVGDAIEIGDRHVLLVEHQRVPDDDGSAERVTATAPVDRRVALLTNVERAVLDALVREVAAGRSPSTRSLARAASYGESAVRNAISSLYVAFGPMPADVARSDARLWLAQQAMHLDLRS